MKSGREFLDNLPNIKMQDNPIADIKIQDKSIWKPTDKLAIASISEMILVKTWENVISLATHLSDKEGWCYIESESLGVTRNCLDKFCYLSDFINQQEQLEARITKLEGNE